MLEWAAVEWVGWICKKCGRETAMRYDPAISALSANTSGNALYRRASTMRPPDCEAASRQAAELDVWEDEGGTIAAYEPELLCLRAPRHFDEFSG